MKRLAIGFLAGVVVTLLTVGPVQGGVGNCKPAWKCAPATAAPTAASTSVASSPTPAPTIVPTAGGYSFDDEFDGSTLSSAWQHRFHCCGTVTMDPSTTSVSGGTLRMTAVNRSGTWFTDVVSTTFTQTYGYFEARIQIPRGKGLWPAFWSYPGSGTSELDTMEICANPLGANGGNDASLLHTTIHFADGSSSGHAYRTADLSGGFHVYAEDWRADHVTFYLDGGAVWTYTGATPVVPMPAIVDLGVGGSWCSAPDATTPSPATMLVDWVRVRS